VKKAQAGIMGVVASVLIEQVAGTVPKRALTKRTQKLRDVRQKEEKKREVRKASGPGQRLETGVTTIGSKQTLRTNLCVWGATSAQGRILVA